jgi:hypothetical protein
MKRTLFVLAVLAAFATSAGAATLTVVSDKASYNVGETITLTVTGDEGTATAYGIFGKLNYTGALVDNGTRTQTVLVGPYGKWITGVLAQSDDGINASSYAFSQITSSSQGATNLPGTLSTVTLIAKAAGLVNVDWDTTNSNTALRLDFFGLTNAAGTSFTIIPEPTTVALLGIGLLGLALGGRRRS